MESNVSKAIKSLGYVLLEEEAGRYVFKKTNANTFSTLSFNTSNKYIHAFLFPIRTIEEQRDITLIYADYKKMIEEIQYLSKLTGYSIINNIEKD